MRLTKRGWVVLLLLGFLAGVASGPIFWDSASQTYTTSG